MQIQRRKWKWMPMNDLLNPEHNVETKVRNIDQNCTNGRGVFTKHLKQF